ncbi:MAG: tail fiber domain-containing protein [Bacteroidota bacterium]
MKLKTLFTLLLFLAIQGMVFAQWTTIAGSSDIRNTNNGNVLIRQGPLSSLSIPTFGQLDVRGDNFILADPSTTTFPRRFIGLGVAGGGSPNACPGYGLRIQPNTDVAMNVFLLQDQFPAIQFGPTTFYFVYKQDPFGPGCGGRVIGINPNNTNLLTVAGSVIATAYNISSDKRLKNNFNEISSPLDKILATNGQRYFYRNDIENYAYANMPETEQIGYIAQELREVLPQAVDETESGYLSVKYHMLIPVVTEAMKEQQNIIEDQKDRINELESRLNRIEQLLTKQQGELEINSDNVQLRQNRPNPFGKNTTIDYKLPNDFNNASIRIIDAAGKEIRNYSINDASGQLQVDGSKLTSGIYYYSLVIDGKAVRTEKMVVR